MRINSGKDRLSVDLTMLVLSTH